MRCSLKQVNTSQFYYYVFTYLLTTKYFERDEHRRGDTYGSEDVVGVTENEFRVGRRRHLQLETTHVDIGAQGPEMRLLHAVDAVQL